MEQLSWNLAYSLTCRSVGSACPYIMCKYRWETISSVKVKERGDFIRLALWHTSAIQTQAWHILCNGRERINSTQTYKCKLQISGICFPGRALCIQECFGLTHRVHAQTNTSLLGEQLPPWHITKCFGFMPQHNASWQDVCQANILYRERRRRIFILS